MMIPAVCCAALLAVAGAAVLPGRLAPAAKEQQGVMMISTIPAGEETAAAGGMRADIGSNAKVRIAGQETQSLYASGGSDIPLVTVGGAVYRMLSAPADIGSELLGGQVGSVASFAQEPSLLSQNELAAGVSNVAGEGTAVYAVDGLDASTAVAAKVDGSTRLFQRVSYAGRGPGGQGLEDVFDVRGRVRSMELTGRGELTGDAAEEVIGVLLDCATLVSADASVRGEYLTVTLDSGLRLQMGVSGDTLSGCGGWSCPEFFEAFDAAL